jgi:ABC-2 type transport system permease protein
LINFSVDVGYEIKDGEISNHLLKPLNIFKYYYFRAISQKFNQTIIVLPFYFLIFFLLFFINQSYFFNLQNLSVALIITVFAIQLSYFFELFLTWIAFWIDDAWPLEHLKIVLLTILGGIAFPLDFLPPKLNFIVELLPFKFFYYVPISYILGKRSLDQFLIYDVLALIFWIAFFYLTAKFLYFKGLKKYEAYGH